VPLTPQRSQLILQSAIDSVKTPSAYNPAIVQLRFTEARGRTTQPDTDSFLDLTLIPASGAITGRRVEVSSSSFVIQLKRLYTQLSRQEDLDVTNANAASRRLYELLIGPLRDELERQKISTLLIGADRGLQAVPYAALHSGREYVGERFAFSLTPSLSLTNLSIATIEGPRLLAAGASQFDGLAPLPLVRQEIAAIATADRKDELLDAAFTPVSFARTSADPRYQRIHLATHAEFLPGGPSKSQLYSGNGAIPLSTLATMRQQRRGASLDLIALSACRTALGDSDTELGFAGLALQAGARSAIGTLWYVDDVATSAFFIQVYRYLDQGLPKAEALQFTRRDFSSGRVQLVGNQLIANDGQSLLSGLTKEQQRRVSRGLSNPYYWSGIELLGAPW
jgi:CHAT domain-containing protein